VKTSKDFKVVKYILECVEYHPETDKKMTVVESIDYIKNRFNGEVKWRIERDGEHSAMVDWLQGLALNIEYMNYNIELLGIEWGYITNDSTDKQKGNFVDNYWSLMATKILQLFRGYGVKCYV